MKVLFSIILLWASVTSAGPLPQWILEAAGPIKFFGGVPNKCRENAPSPNRKDFFYEADFDLESSKAYSFAEYISGEYEFVAWVKASNICLNHGYNVACGVSVQELLPEVEPYLELQSARYGEIDKTVRETTIGYFMVIRCLAN